MLAPRAEKRAPDSAHAPSDVRPTPSLSLGRQGHRDRARDKIDWPEESA